MFFFNPEDKIYKEHFIDNPVVPGSLIIHAFIEAASLMGFDKKFLLLKKFRFMKFITPGEYSYRIEDEKDSLKCFLYIDNKIAVSGEIIL